MGQQQLLLVILVTVIVGIATVVAINTFSSASEAANRDAATNDMVAIAAAAQAYYIKPLMLNGGGNSFADIDFQNIAFAGVTSGDFLSAINVNGTYVISNPTAANFTLTGHPASCSGYAGVMPTSDVIGPTYGSCAATDDIVATVQPNNITWATN